MKNKVFLALPFAVSSIIISAFFISSTSAITKEVKIEPKNQTPFLIDFVYNHNGAPKYLKEQDIEQAFLRASSMWKQACNVEFRYKGKTQLNPKYNDGLQKDGIGVIFWSNNMNPNNAATAHLGSSNSPATGFLMPLNVNAVNTRANLQLQLNWLFLHEMGHVIGLNHKAQKGSVMDVKKSANGNNLSQEDINDCNIRAKNWKTF